MGLLSPGFRVQLPEGVPFQRRIQQSYLHVKPWVAGLSPVGLAKIETVAQVIEQRIKMRLGLFLSALQGVGASNSNGTTTQDRSKIY